MQYLRLILPCVVLAGCLRGSVAALPVFAASASSIVRQSDAGTNKLTLLYDFKGTPDGEAPMPGLAELNGTLYGTTGLGGASRYGTVYKLTPSGETVLHSFTGGADGGQPFDQLIDVNGTIYGTTENGGTGNGCGCGMVYRFSGGTDGNEPLGSLIAVNGALYGTTSAQTDGMGTAFGISL